jgi:hypothetical protein
MILQAVWASAQTAFGVPVHRLPQQSEERVQAEPFGRQADVQTRKPRASGEHVPWQQSELWLHGEPAGRHGPAVKPQGTVRLHAAPLQHVPRPSSHLAPAGLQLSCPLPVHCPKLSQLPKQQSALVVQVASSPLEQNGPPQTPLWQSRPQQSIAALHGAPSPTQ